MKTITYLLMLGSCLIFNVTLYAQNESGIDSTGLPGDNFSLQGALEMFKKAASPEEFEKLINTEDNSVNNLDLNGDGAIDYIRVIDKADKDAHAIVLQVAISETETQDIAVIELEKTANASATLQIIGDEDLYGEPVIVEPGGSAADNSFTEEESNTVARGGPLAAESSVQQNFLVVNIFFWPSVRFIYGPVYRPWASPWRWHNYPGWWRPWRPFSWQVFHPRAYRYHKPFVVVHTHRLIRAHQIYTPIRVSSVTVRTRHSVAINNYRVNRAKPNTSRPGSNSASPAKSNVSRPANSSAAPAKPNVSKPTNNQAHGTSATVKEKHVKVKATKTKAKRNR